MHDVQLWHVSGPAVHHIYNLFQRQVTTKEERIVSDRLARTALGTFSTHAILISYMSVYAT